jgi:hypothetical protein
MAVPHRLALLALLIVVGVSAGSPHQSAAPREPAELARHLIAGMKHNRALLISGAFRATGHKFTNVGVPQPVQGNVDIYCCFDYRNGTYRFDRLEPWRSTKLIDPPGNFKGDPGAPRQVTNVEMLGGKYIKSH